jgi:hypothetical protein
MFNIWHGGRIDKSKDNALNGLLPKWDDDQMPNAKFPRKRFRHGIIKYPRDGRDVDGDLNKGDHCGDCT